ncbi:Chorismate synthase [Geodia barretti]|uniref:Chorismate synthase n=1 Tax=Geodia barretti TaxID=519541 RepID=A0AA35T193_GEOBA|nr:Chorismate synthase [Geodia barretti]
MGRRLVLTTFGESHGKCVGAVLDGCPAGLKLEEGDIQGMLDQRRPGQSAISTQRAEGDKVEILSGVFRGSTTGAPIAMIIWNRDQRSTDYEELKTKLRPGHSDYPAMIKYKGHNDYRGGGRFSGRLTATLVMGGAIARKLTHSYVSQIGKVAMGKRFTEKMIPDIYGNDVRCPDPEAAALMRAAILGARRDMDSLGGMIESVTTGLPVGLGEPVFGSLESDISSGVFSIPSVKGVEFGSGFAGSESTGSQNNDTRTNNAGGILGGISIGMPLTLRVAFKPASSIPREQPTVDIKSGKDAVLSVKGRHDPCVVPRAPPVVDSVVALVLADHALLGGFIGPVL